MPTNESPSLRLRVGHGDDVTTFSLAVDRFAATKDGTVYLLGLAGSQAALKGVRAWLNAGVAAIVEFEDLVASSPQEAGRIKHCQPHEEDYAVHSCPIGYGWHHGLFVSRRDGFLASLSGAAIWASLKSASFTTPLLRGWVPYLTEELRAKGKLVPLFCYGCECGLITAEDVDLDAIVTSGVRAGKLPFRELTLTTG